MKIFFEPEYVIEVADSALGLKGILVIDNTVLGPGKGGIRMTPTVTTEEVKRLARTMTWKNALAGLPFGGAKAGMVWSGADVKLKQAQVQSFARALKPFLIKKYIAGPDVNSGEREMAWFAGAVGNRRATTGKPRRLGGLPHELGSTGFGVAEATRAAVEVLNLPLAGLTVAIDGFGNVGSFALKFLTELGARVVAVADSRGTIYNPAGLPPRELLKWKQTKRTVATFPDGQKMSRGDVFALAVDVLIPASVTDVINKHNKNEIRAKIIVEGANIPMPEAVEEELSARGVLIVPDFIANAGGVISSYAEYRGWSAEKMFKLVKQKIGLLTKQVVKTSLAQKKNPRAVALALAETKIQAAMKKRRTVFG